MEDKGCPGIIWQSVSGGKDKINKNENIQKIVAFLDTKIDQHWDIVCIDDELRKKL